eukprot:COSAG02_NODE_1269_length_13533_cov_7.935016_1_plen_34_part_10
MLHHAEDFVEEQWQEEARVNSPFRVNVPALQVGN